MTPQHQANHGLDLAMKAAAEHEGKKDVEIVVPMGEREYTIVIAALQLAMRNPTFKKSPSYGVVRGFVDSLIGMCPEDRPALKQLLLIGDQTQG